MHSNSPNSQTWPWFQPPLANHRQLSYPPPFVDPFVMQQSLGSQARAMLWCNSSTPMQHFYTLICVGPVYQGQQYQHQYRPSSSGPSRNQHSKGHHMTEAQYSYHFSHESSGTTTRNRSSGIHHALMDASNNSGTGGAWKPPSGNPLIVNRDSTQQMRIKPYNRDRSNSSRTRRSRTDKVDLSVYEIPIVDSRRGAMIRGSSIHAVNPASTPPIEPKAASATAGARTSRNRNMREQWMEEEDFDSISLSSDIDSQ